MFVLFLFKRLEHSFILGPEFIEGSKDAFSLQTSGVRSSTRLRTNGLNPSIITGLSMSGKVYHTYIAKFSDTFLNVNCTNG